MNGDSNTDIIEMLRHEIEKEWRKYELALRARKEFWELKQIRTKIHDLENTMGKIKEINATTKSKEKTSC